jgi:hypothetical protein
VLVPELMPLDRGHRTAEPVRDDSKDLGHRPPGARRQASEIEGDRMGWF